ncbi:MAG: guanylate kinase [Gemmatimonadota bacterium]
MILVLAAPSGAGKTTLAHALVEHRTDVEFSLSATTRPPRPGEQHDEDYHFVDDAGFDRLLADGELLEWAMVHGRRYGTMRAGVEAALAAGRHVVLDIDVQGAQRVRRSLPDAGLVFILPPSAAEMLRRLRTRGSEGPEELKTRMRTALAELDAVSGFDHVIINAEFGEALAEIESILDGSAPTQDDAEIAAVLERLRADINDIIQGGI